MTWIRWECDTSTGDAVMDLAEALNIEPALAHGLHVGACCGMGRHQPDGHLTEVTDTALEQWALWRGKRGRFAQAFRARCMDERGDLRGWWRQEALMKKRDNDRKRAKQSRDSRATSRRDVADSSHDSPMPTDGRTDERTEKIIPAPQVESWLEPWLKLYRAHVGDITAPHLAKAVAGPRGHDEAESWRSFRAWCTDPEQRKFCPKVTSWSERWRSFVPADLTKDRTLFPPRVGSL